MIHGPRILPGNKDKIAAVRRIIEVGFEIGGEDRERCVDRMAPTMDQRGVGEHAVNDSEKEEIRQRLVRHSFRSGIECFQRRDVVVGDALCGLGVACKA